MNSIVGFTSMPMEFWKGPLRHYTLCCYLKCWHFIMEVSSGKFWTDHLLPSWVIAQGILCRLFPVFVKSTDFSFLQNLFFFIIFCIPFPFAFALTQLFPHGLIYPVHCHCKMCVYMEIKLLSSAYGQLSEFPIWLPPYCLWYIFFLQFNFSLVIRIITKLPLSPIWKPLVT